MSILCAQFCVYSDMSVSDLCSTLSQQCAWVLPCFVMFSVAFLIRVLTAEDMNQVFLLKASLELACEIFAVITAWRSMRSREDLKMDPPLDVINEVFTPSKPIKKRNRRKKLCLADDDDLRIECNSEEAITQCFKKPSADLDDKDDMMILPLDIKTTAVGTTTKKKLSRKEKRKLKHEEKRKPKHDRLLDCKDEKKTSRLKVPEESKEKLEPELSNAEFHSSAHPEESDKSTALQQPDQTSHGLLEHQITLDVLAETEINPVPNSVPEVQVPEIKEEPKAHLTIEPKTGFCDENNNVFLKKTVPKPVVDYMKEPPKRTYIVGLNPVVPKKKKKKSKKGEKKPHVPTLASPQLGYEIQEPTVILTEPAPESQVLRPVGQQVYTRNPYSPTKKQRTHKRQGYRDIENRRHYNMIIREADRNFEPSQYFTNSGRSEDELYNKLQPYILTQEELRDRNFPIAGVTKGQIIGQNEVAMHLRSQSDDDISTTRHCDRCGDPYVIQDNFYYSSLTSSCVYHSQKIEDNCGQFMCCGGGYNASGCRLHRNHVSSATDLTNIVFRKTRTKKAPNNHVYALDCEMVYTTIGMEVAKVSLVRLDGQIVIDCVVRPTHPVLDCNTEFSGLTSMDIDAATTTLGDVQDALMDLVDTKTILVGHALENDLRVLHIVHPTVVDTQAVFSDKTMRRRKLRDLVRYYLGQEIQTPGRGHCAVEDARACADLMLKKVTYDTPRRCPVPIYTFIKPAFKVIYRHHCQDCLVPPPVRGYYPPCYTTTYFSR